MTGPFLIFAVVVAALLGLIIGSFLNVVTYRVPAGIPLQRESRCPACGARVRWWQNVPVVSWIALRAKCASCGEHISGRYPLVELITGVAFAAVTWWFLVVRPEPTLAATLVVTAAFLYFAAIGIVLTVIDLDTHRLPNAIVLPSYIVALIALVVASLLGASWSSWLPALVGMAALYAFFFVLRAVRPGGMGGGDVKLAGLVGLYLGWIGWAAIVVGLFAAFLLGGLFGVALLVGRKAGRRTAIPFGPWIVAGAWVGIFAGDALAHWYLNLALAA